MILENSVLMRFRISRSVLFRKASTTCRIS